MIYTLTLNPAVDRELSVPALEYDQVLRATATRVDFGGKGLNVSRQLAALGVESYPLGFAGGPTGRLLQTGLANLGIPPEFVWIAGETRTNVSIVAADQEHYIKVNEPGPPISPAEQLLLLDKVRSLAMPGDWWVLAGSLPLGVPAPFYAEVIRILQPAGAFTVLDTAGEALRHGCEAGPFLVKPNALELGELTGLPVTTPTEAKRAARRVLQMGAGAVVVSLGKAGALFLNQAGSGFATAPSIQERNPIGAGDSMVAGIVWGLSQGFTLARSVRWGVACGAATASLDGTAVGERLQIEMLCDQVDV